MKAKSKFNTEQKTKVLKRLSEIKSKTERYAQLFEVIYKSESIRGSAAIRAKCLDCCAWQSNEIRHCESVTCPLWRLRPFQIRNGEPNSDQM
jgi:sulfur transfer protein SufE